MQTINSEQRTSGIALHSADSNTKSTAKSQCAWILAEPIVASDTHTAGIIYLNQFVTNNTFANITSANNILKIVSEWTDAVGVTIFEDVITITVKPGHYTVTELVAYLNDRCYRVDGGFFYGLGTDTGVTAGNGFTVGTSRISIHSLLTDTAVWSNQIANTHRYRSFYLRNDATTAPLMTLLGFTSSQKIGFSLGTHFEEQAAAAAYEYRALATTDTYAISTTGLYEAVSSFDLSGIKSIVVRLVEIQGTLQTPAHLGKNAIATIPIFVAYGSRIVFQPASPIKIEVPNLSMYAISIDLSDEKGVPIDLQGSEYTMTLVVEWKGVRMHTSTSINYNTSNPHQIDSATSLNYGTLSRESSQLVRQKKARTDFF